jgi:outer membrane protein assembly factor BamE (lipoprotein component of BamABCDE complex)
MSRPCLKNSRILSIWKLMLTVWATAWLIGCATQNQSARSINLLPGMAASDVRKTLGKPDIEQKSENGETLAYYYAWKKDPRFADTEGGYQGPTMVSTLSILYDKEGRLNQHMTSAGAIIGNQKIRGGRMAGMLIQELTPADTIPGKTTLSQIVNRLGEPTVTALGSAGGFIHQWFYINSTSLSQPEAKVLTIVVTVDSVLSKAPFEDTMPIPTSLFEREPQQKVQLPGNPHEDMVPLGFGQFFR